jgi:hypothetical protein
VETVVSLRATALAEQIARAVEEFASLVAGCDDAQWQATVADEGWPVGFVVRHVGWGLRAHRRLVTLAARGEPLPDLTLSDIDDANRKSLTEQPYPERERTLHFLQRETAETVSVVRALSDEELALTTRLSFFRAEPVTIETLITDLLLWHINSHTPGVHAALA